MGKRQKRMFDLTVLTQEDLMTTRLTPSEEAFIAKNKGFIEDLIESHHRLDAENKKLRKDMVKHVASIKKLRKQLNTNSNKPVSKHPKRKNISDANNLTKSGKVSKVTVHHNY